MSLTELYTKMEKEYSHNQGFTDKGAPYHTYIGLYDKELAPYRKNVNMLEIGVDHGGSLALWTKYFESYKLLGVDLHPDPIANQPYTDALRADPNIQFRFGKSSTEESVAEEFEDKSFDVIIDDGSHEPNIQIETFRVWFPKLKPGGVFFVEDILGDAYKYVKISIVEYLDALDVDYIVEDYLGNESELVRDDDDNSNREIEMTVIIAHRGNLYGPDSIVANTNDRIKDIMNNTDFSVEVDLRGGEYLGHDEPGEAINPLQYDKTRVFYHAKDLDTYFMFREKYPSHICFSHDKDDVAVVSNGLYWTNRENLTWSNTIKAQTILVMNERLDFNIPEMVKYKGICTDYPVQLSRMLKEKVWV